jgi:hypothetical protein
VASTTETPPTAIREELTRLRRAPIATTALPQVPGCRTAGDQRLLALPYAETVVDDGVRLQELAQGGEP